MSRKNINLQSPRLPVSVSPRQPDSRPVLHRARLVVPIIQPPIEDGAVVVANGVILDVGPFKLLRRQWLEAPARDHAETALLPALVNAHVHLDLSGLAGQVEPMGSMAEWIRSLLATREQFDEDHLEKARVLALDALRAFGTGIAGDIVSSGICSGGLPGDIIIVQRFLEVFGLHTQSLEVAIDQLRPTARQILTDNQESVSLAAHAPYTTSASLLRQVKEWGAARAKVISVHAAESEEEILFLHSGQGPIRDLLEERGHEPSQWEVPGCGTVTYLDRLGFLDSLTLCVHAVQLSKEEVQVVQRSGAELPQNVEVPTDWEIVKRIAEDRYDKAAKGQYTGDEIDIAVISAAVIFLFLLFSAIFFASCSWSRKRNSFSGSLRTKITH